MSLKKQIWVQFKEQVFLKIYDQVSTQVWYKAISIPATLPELLKELTTPVERSILKVLENSRKENE